MYKEIIHIKFWLKNFLRTTGRSFFMWEYDVKRSRKRSGVQCPLNMILQFDFVGIMTKFQVA